MEAMEGGIPAKGETEEKEEDEDGDAEDARLPSLFPEVAAAAAAAVDMDDPTVAAATAAAVVWDMGLHTVTPAARAATAADTVTLGVWMAVGARAAGACHWMAM